MMAKYQSCSVTIHNIELGERGDEVCSVNVHQLSNLGCVGRGRSEGFMSKIVVDRTWLLTELGCRERY